MDNESLRSEYCCIIRMHKYNLVFKEYYYPSHEEFSIFDGTGELVGRAGISMITGKVTCWDSCKCKVIYEDKVCIITENNTPCYSTEDKMCCLEKIAKVLHDMLDKESSDKTMEENKMVTHYTDFDKAVYKLYLVTITYYNDYDSRDFYVIAKNPTEAEKIVIDAFTQNNNTNITVTNIKFLTKQVYNSDVGCALDKNPDGTQKTIPFLSDKQCRLMF